MKYSLYEECIHKYTDLKFSREELDIIQDTFNISAIGNCELDNGCITKSVNNFKCDHFKINRDLIEYMTQDTYFWYLNAPDLNCAHLDLKKSDGVYYVHIKNNNLYIKYYDSLALSCFQDRYGNVKMDKDIIEYFSAMGILPDNVYESNINLQVLDHFNIIKLLMTKADTFNMLFNGDNIDDLLMEQKYGPVKKKRR